MADAAVTLLLEQMKEILIRPEVEIIRLLWEELGFMKAFLKDAVTATKPEEPFRVLERQIIEVVYEVEDTIDMYMTEVTIKARAKKKMSVPFINFKRVGLGKAIKSIREEKVLPLLEHVKNMLATMQITDGSNSRGLEDLRTEFKRDKHQNRVVGLEDEEETIIGYLMQEKEHLDVITIIGMPGLGKTTLARKIYQNKNICDHFPIRIWVYISEEFSSRDVFIQILRKLIPNQDMSGLGDAELVQNVREGLKNRENFLLVLDDIWSVDDWNEIAKGLPLGNGQGKVLITSRDIDVGKRSSLHGKPHVLRFLRGDESWMLLQYEVFGNLEDCPQELIPIGEDIANKCGGLPLIIVVIAGILMDQFLRSTSTNAAMREWEMVLKTVCEQNGLMDALTCSYHRLPYDLRDCFVYMGIFPEYYEIPVMMLYRLWISEGFIEPHTDGRRRSLEESAEEKLNYLITRNLVKVEKTNPMGEVKTCRVNVLIRAFCIIKSKEHNLFHEIKISKTTGEIEPPVSQMHQFHRLCVYSGLSDFLSRRPNGPRVRSVLCFHQQPNELEYISAIRPIPDGFPKLRILESKSIKFHRFPAKLTKLIHLRYLTLFIETLTSLPEEISQLWNLQTLTVNTNSSSFIMKANMWRMMQLKHFTTTAAIVLDIKWKGEAGENLQTLGMLSAESCTEQVSRRATNLKTLGISGNVAKIFETKVLEKSKSLEKLKLVNTLIGDELTIEDFLHRLPQSNCFPPNLKRLTLMNTLLRWKDMSTLSMIKSLEILKLKDNAFVGVSWKVAEYSFPKLQVLLIVNADLILWQASTDAFPSLRYLVIKKCENLRAIPVYVGTHLEKLEIEHLRDSAVESARKIAESRKREPEGNSADEFHLIIGPGCEGYGA